MRLGFTGTSDPQRVEQLVALRMELRRLAERFEPTEFHHGDCVNADENAHKLVMQDTTAKVVIHPPNNDYAQAFCSGDLYRIERRQPKPYLERNRDIVDETDELLACPRSKLEQRRSGTWATIRYARKKGKPITIILPDGRVMRERNS